MSKYYKAEDIINFLNVYCPKDMWEYQISDLPTYEVADLSDEAYEVGYTAGQMAERKRKTEVSEDAISREWLKKWMFTEWDGNQLTAFKMTDFAPSVAPKAKEGEWLESPYEDADGMPAYRCSECGCLCGGGLNYCFKCEAKMRDDNVETD